MHLNYKNKLSIQKGFTLLELMIVTAVIGVLAAIAYPSYQNYAIKTKRGDMMAEMQQIASRIESNKINYKRYDRIPLSAVFRGNIDSDGNTKFPSSENALYTVSIDPIDATKTRIDDKTWTISAVPVPTKQLSNDGTLTLQSNGRKCRNNVCGTGTEWN